MVRPLPWGCTRIRSIHVFGILCAGLVGSVCYICYKLFVEPTLGPPPNGTVQP